MPHNVLYEMAKWGISVYSVKRISFVPDTEWKHDITMQRKLKFWRKHT